MESLLANYASSDEEEENPNRTSISSKPLSSSSSLSSLITQPKCSLPQFKQQSSTPIIHHTNEEENPPKPYSKFSPSFFSSLPQPKTQALKQPSNIALDPKPKKVVQFKPPINPTYTDFDDEEDEDEEEKERKKRKQSESLSQLSSVKSFLSSIPAPKNSSTLGALPSAAGSGRRSIIETEAPSPNLGCFGAEKDQNEGNYGSNGGISASYEQASHQNEGIYVDYGGYSSYESGTSQDTGQNVVGGDYGSTYGNYESYSSYGNYGDYGQNGNSCGDGLAVAVPEGTGAIESAFRVQGKKGRKDIPTEVIEVKQDELTKNRPREDQVKLTGIAFGPSYQPTSTKGKPSKLHKRKHQIGSLYYDIKQKEMELAERRAKGFLTKAQTQAKYGW